MTYIGRSERTAVLIETIEDADKLVGTIDTGKISETQAHRLATALLMIVATAKRHPDWPEAEVPVVAAPAPSPAANIEPEVVTGPGAF